MQFTLRPLQGYDVNAIITWRYDGPYAYYNRTARDFQAYWPPRLLTKWMGYECYAVVDEQRFLAGFFQFHKLPYHTLEIGLALRPDLTGRGYGLAFVEAGLAFGKQRYAARRFQLTVADFNLRARKVYTRAGFHLVDTFTKQTKQGPALFHAMERDV